MESDNPTGAASSPRQAADLFGKFQAIGSRPLSNEAPRAPQPEEERNPEPVANEAVEAVEAEEVDQADDVEAEFGEDTETDDAEPVEVEATDDDEVFIVKVDGKEVEVTLDELQAGYSRQSDYTRKTQALADERRAFEGERQQTLQTAQALQERLREVETYLAGTEPDWQQLAQQLDPKEFNLARLNWEQQQQQAEAVKAQQAELQRIQQAELERELQRAQARLPEIIPDWQNTEVAQQEARQIRDYALGVGFSEEALNSLVDPLAVKVLRDAWRYNQLQEQAPKIRRKKSRTPKQSNAGPGLVTKSPNTKAKERVLNGPVSVRDKETQSFFQSITPRK